MNDIELLAPAGSYETMQAALRAGADAVYMGGRLFGARAYADNPEDDKLLEAIDYVHMRGKRLYLTVNTLLKNDEINGLLYDYIKPIYLAGLDAVIVQDVGVMRFFQEHFPGLHIHASTQMTVTGEYGAKFLAGQKQITRVVTARELSLAEIARIHETCDLEIESFVHGALCYSYSGQCLFSSLAGGRSGNRGRCAQPCRMQYKEVGGSMGYFISPKDLCTIDILPDVLEAGVTSLKIEGRMKKPEYTAGVVSVYRKYLDMYLKKGRSGYKVLAADKQLLLDLFNRGGFCDGYYNKHNGRDMIFIEGKDNEEKGRNEAAFNKMRALYIDSEPEKFGLAGEAYVFAGESVRMNVTCGDIYVSVEGDMVEEAKNQPMSVEKISKQLGKLGGTEFEWKSDLEVYTDDKSFISVTALNALRRDAIAAVKESMLGEYRRSESELVKDTVQKSEPEEVIQPGEMPYASVKADGYDIYSYVENIGVLKELVNVDGIAGFYPDTAALSDDDIFKAIQICKDNGKKVYPVLPHIFRTNAAKWLEGMYDRFETSGIDGLMVRSPEELEWLRGKNSKLELHFDYTVYAYNNKAHDFWNEYKPELMTLSVELNAAELGKIKGGNNALLVYGRIPMMVSAQCVRKTTGSGKCKVEDGRIQELTDRMNNVFPVKNYCKFCYNHIYNCKPVSLLTQQREIERIAPKVLRLDFTIETPSEAKLVAEKFVAAFLYREDIMELKDFTRGHFKRGIR